MKPDPGLAPSEATEIMIMADSKNIYIGLRCHDRFPESIKASLSSRDRIDGDDWISIELDPFNSGQTCYLVPRVNPLGIQADGMLNSMADDVSGTTTDDLTFDTQWQSRGRLTDSGYEMEVAIPFSSLRFPSEKQVTVRAGSPPLDHQALRDQHLPAALISRKAPGWCSASRLPCRKSTFSAAWS